MAGPVIMSVPFVRRLWYCFSGTAAARAGSRANCCAADRLASSRRCVFVGLGRVFGPFVGAADGVRWLADTRAAPIDAFIKWSPSVPGDQTPAQSHRGLRPPAPRRAPGREPGIAIGRRSADRLRAAVAPRVHGTARINPHRPTDRAGSDPGSAKDRPANRRRIDLDRQWQRERIRRRCGSEAV